VARQLLSVLAMQELDDKQLASVCGGESFRDVVRAVRALPDVPLEQTAAQTQAFIAEHPFFHQGVMNLPIGGGRHFRNVPFVGPARMLGGALRGDSQAVRKGLEVTRGTWNAS
jgi:hypothetical protein